MVVNVGSGSCQCIAHKLIKAAISLCLLYFCERSLFASLQAQNEDKKKSRETLDDHRSNECSRGTKEISKKCKS